MPASFRAADDPLGGGTEADAQAQQPSELPAYSTASIQREGGAIERWQDVLAQAVVDAHDYSKQDELAASVAEQAAWQQGQAAQQAVPLPAALRQRAAQRAQQVLGPGAAGRQGAVAYSTEEQRYEGEELWEAAATPAGASGEDDSAEREAEAQAEREAEAERQARLQAAEDELREAEDLVGWAEDEADVDVPRGIALLEALFARWGAGWGGIFREGWWWSSWVVAWPCPSLGAHGSPARTVHCLCADITRQVLVACRLDGIISAALEESMLQRQSMSPPQAPVDSSEELAAVGSDGDGAADEAAEADSAVSAVAADGGETETVGATELTSNREAVVVAADEAAAAAPVGSNAAFEPASMAGPSTASDTPQQHQQAQPLQHAHSMPSALAMEGLGLDPYELPELGPLSNAAVTLAALLSSGIAAAHGLRRNDSRAAYMLHRAAAAGSLEARVALADRYLSGRGVPRLPDEGLRHAKVAGPELLALLDEAGAVSRLAGCYGLLGGGSGVGVPARCLHVHGTLAEQPARRVCWQAGATHLATTVRCSCRSPW